MKTGLTYSLIRQARSGDIVAIGKIMEIYEPYITKLATEYMYDREGNECIGINVAVRDVLRSKLLDVVQNYKIS